MTGAEKSVKHIQAIYDSLWQTSITNFKNNTFEFDDNLNHLEQDQRRGITLIGRLGQGTQQAICEFLHNCKKIQPDQHYYGTDELHITILSIISCYSGFSMEMIDKDAYIDIIKRSIMDHGPLKMIIRGITASPSCIMLQGFPVNDGLESLRKDLRLNFRNSTLKHSMDERYLLETAHGTVVRFKNPMRSGNSFLNYISKYRDYDFGISEIDKIHLVYNDWYMTNTIVTEIETFSL